jgi:hypothetical protein
MSLENDSSLKNTIDQLVQGLVEASADDSGERGVQSS